MKRRLLIFLLVVSFIPLLDLFGPGLPVTHDGQDHVARIANFYQNLSEGNIIPRWAANLNWGYGHPILMFLYPLPSYVTSLFHFIGLSLIDSTKLVFAIAYVFSGLTMYLWINEFLGKRAAFISALLYLLAPYRFVDLYVRGAIGEHVAFVFPPLLLFFLLKLSQKYCYWYVLGGSLSLAGLLLSHNAISLMFLPLIFLYAFYLFWQLKSKRLLVMSYGLLVIVGFGLAAFFWMPAFFEGKYTLRDIVTKGEYASRFVPLQSFFIGPWSYGITGQFTTQVGVVQWLAVLLTIPAVYFLYKKKNPLWIMGASLLLLFLATLFLMTSYSKFVWQTVTIIQKFQFPWRLLSIAVFITSVLGGLTVVVFSKRVQTLALILLFFALFWFNKDYWHAKDYLVKQEVFFTNIYDSTTDTGESSPIWSVRFMEKRPQAHIEIIQGNGTIRERKRTSTLHSYEVETKEKTKFRENTLYFPGWQVFVAGEKTPIEFQDPANRGLMTFFVGKGTHIIDVRFSETKLRLMADLISGLTILGLGFYSMGKLLWRRYR